MSRFRIVITLAILLSFLALPASAAKSSGTSNNSAGGSLAILRGTSRRRAAKLL